MLRLMAGLGMIAAGSSLAAPAGLQVAAWWQASTAGENRGAGGPAGSPPAPEWAVPAAPEWAASRSAPAPSGSTADPALPAAVPRGDYLPPPPPEPLPGLAAGLTAPSPVLSSHYRTTLAAPPPPLLDGQRPPPLAVGWNAWESGPAAVRPPPAVPWTGRYRVRDGDDLTSIALRFYGTPAVARALWEANRDRLPDPGLLSIGLELRLPPPADMGHLTGSQAVGRRRSIDPVSTPIPVPQPSGGLAAGSWLAPDSRGENP